MSLSERLAEYVFDSNHKSYSPENHLRVFHNSCNRGEWNLVREEIPLSIWEQISHFLLRERVWGRTVGSSHVQWDKHRWFSLHRFEKTIEFRRTYTITYAVRWMARFWFRWKTWQAAISPGELQVSFDPGISESVWEDGKRRELKHLSTGRKRK